MRSNSLKDYEVIIASDVNERDAIGIEVWSNEQLLIEVFRDDVNEEYTISVYEEDLSLSLVEEAIKRFKQEIPSVFQK